MKSEVLKRFLDTPWKRWTAWILGMVLVLLVVYQIPWVKSRISSQFMAQDTSLQSIMPSRGTFVHEVAIRGDISSSSNVDIKCNVRSQGGTMLLSVVEEGTVVKQGDLLAVLDSSSLIDNKVTQEISCSKSLAELETAKNNLKTAQIAKKEYEEGSYLLSLQKLESSKVAAEEEQSRLKEYLEHSRKLYQKGFITQQQLRADEFALTQAQLNLDSSILEMKVLKDYTHAKALIGYDSDIKTAEANLLAKESAYKLDQTKLQDIVDQITSCRVLAPSDGKVIYVNESRGPAGSEFIVYEGASVRERQTFLRLPDPSKLQVEANVHEGKISYLKVGMPASIRTDATGNRDLLGTVIKVNQLPQPTTFWMGNVKEYRVIVMINNQEGILPGMTADVRVLVERQNNVLMVPTHAVFEHGNRFYAILQQGKKFELRELQLGSSNDKVVIIKSGLTENDRILTAAFQHRDLVKLPELTAGQTSSSDIRTEVDSSHSLFDNKAVKEAQDEQVRVSDRRKGMMRPGMNGRMPEGMKFPEGMPRPPEGGMPPGPPPGGGEGGHPRPGGAGGPPPR